MLMRSFATLATLLFSVQVILCGLRGFGVVEFLATQLATAHAGATAHTGSMHAVAAEPARAIQPDHCSGQGPTPAPAERSGSPDEDRCQSHCQLYAQGITSDDPQCSSPAVALHFAATLFELEIHPVRALHPPTVFPVPPRAGELPILHAALLI